MESKVIREYRANRAKGYPPKSALHYATQTHNPKYAFLDKLHAGEMTLAGMVGPFNVSVRVVHDEDSRLGEDDVTGVFTDEYEPGCIKNTRRDWGTDYKWYRPSNYMLNDEYAYTDLRKQGMSKQVARETVAAWIRDGMKEDANRTYFGMEVAVRVGGREIGSASLWGIDVIDIRDSAPYFIETAEELISEAVRTGRESIPAVIVEEAATIAALAAALKSEPTK